MGNGSRLSRRLTSAAALLVVLSLAAPASAQRQRRLDQRLMKNSPALLTAVRDLANPAASSTVRIVVDDEPAALGTVIRSDGYLLTKASELDDGFEVELPDGHRVPGTIVGVLKEHDLAAVKVEASGLTPITFSAGAVNEAGAGQWLYSTGVGSDAVLAVGNLSVQGLRRIRGNGSLLGVQLGNAFRGIPVHSVDPGGAADRGGLKAGDLILAVNRDAPVSTMRDFVRMLRNAPPNAEFTLTVTRDGRVFELPLHLMNGQAGLTVETQVIGVPVAQVTAGSGAEAAGVKPGDLLIALDDRPLRDTEALVEMIRGYNPGDEIEITLLRGGEEQTLEAKLGYHTGRSIRGEFQNQLGSQLSARAVDFPAVLQHDSVLNADQMGGPLVNLKGEVLGINIARAGRVETYALPAQVLEAAIPELLSGKLPTATAPAMTEEGKPPVQQELGAE